MLPKISNNAVVPLPQIYTSPQQRIKEALESKALKAHLKNFTYRHQSVYQQVTYKNQYVVEDLERFLMKEKMEQMARNRPGYRRQDLLLAERQAA